MNSCPKCEKPFASKYNCKRHVDSVHAKDASPIPIKKDGLKEIGDAPVKWAARIQVLKNELRAEMTAMKQELRQDQLVLERELRNEMNVKYHLKYEVVYCVRQLADGLRKEMKQMSDETRRGLVDSVKSALQGIDCVDQ